MRLVLKFLKPHWKLCVSTVLLLIIDVAGALLAAVNKSSADIDSAADQYQQEAETAIADMQ